MLPVNKARRWAIGLLGLAVLAAGAVLMAGLAQAVSSPIQREAVVALPGLQGEPYRLALLSDIHAGNRAMDRARLSRIVTEVNAAKPDLVVIAGDFVNGEGGHLETDTADLAVLGQLRARYGVVATLGNHEHWTDPAKVRTALEAAGITVLANQAVQRGSITILGTDDAFTHRDDMAATLASAEGLGGVPVAVNHAAEMASRLPPSIGLLLSGHSHCGQIVLPMIGPLTEFLNIKVYDPRYRCGLVRDAGRSVIVTAGLGTGGIPVRIGAPPDWWLITLQGASAMP